MRDHLKTKIFDEKCPILSELNKHAKTTHLLWLCRNLLENICLQKSFQLQATTPSLRLLLETLFKWSSIRLSNIVWTVFQRYDQKRGRIEIVRKIWCQMYLIKFWEFNKVAVTTTRTYTNKWVSGWLKRLVWLHVLFLLTVYKVRISVGLIEKRKSN